MRTKRLPFLLLFLLLSVLCFRGQGIAQGKLSGYMFGDLYYVFGHHDSTIKDQSGFWFRRIYFTYDHKLSDEFSTRFRLELSSPGDYRTKDSIKPFIKDAYLSWKKGNFNVLLGISPTPTWEVIEAHWGYRSVEKTPLDLFKMGDSRDFGIALKGSLGKQKKFSYHAQFGNGEGVRSETNKEKKLMASFRFDLSKNFFAEVYGDYASGALETSSWVFQGFLGYQGKKGRLGLQYSRREAEQGIESERTHLTVASIFGVYNASDKLSLLLRFDRLADPLPAGPTVSYVPFAGTSPFSLLIAGFDWKPIKNVSLIPNVKLVFYDQTDGTRPDKDFYLQLTFFYSWSQ